MTSAVPLWHWQAAAQYRAPGVQRSRAKPAGVKLPTSTCHTALQEPFQGGYPGAVEAHIGRNLPCTAASMEAFRCPSHRSSTGVPAAVSGSSTSSLSQAGKAPSVGRWPAAARRSEVHPALPRHRWRSAHIQGDKGPFCVRQARGRPMLPKRQRTADCSGVAESQAASDQMQLLGVVCLRNGRPARPLFSHCGCASRRAARVPGS